jgi:hypothetical protein
MGNNYLNISIFHYITIISCFICLTLFYFYNLNKLENQNKEQLKQNKEQLKQNTNINNTNNTINPFIEKRLVLQNRDRMVLYNDLHPPERRDQEYAYPDKYVKSLINIPTRGLPDNYSPMGVLVRKDDEKVLQLYGRQKYPGSNEWEYYVMGNDPSSFPNKMPIQRKNKREIMDKDKIKIHWLDPSKGDFEVNLYDYDVPRYDPYVLN